MREKFKTDLPYPHVPAADDGLIDKVDYDSDSVYAYISYIGMSVGDTVNLFFDNAEVNSKTILSPDVIELKIAQRYMTNGLHVLDYSVTDRAGNTSTSKQLLLWIQKDTVAEKIVPPALYGEEDGCLTVDEINLYDGALISVPVTQALSDNVGNKISIEWLRYDTAGNIINASPNIHTIVISSDIAVNGLTWIIPQGELFPELNGIAYFYYYIEVGSERIYSESVMLKVGNCSGGGSHYNFNLFTNRDEIIADNIDFAELTAIVQDTDMRPVAGVDITWDHSGGVLVATSQTDVNGVSRVTLSTQVVGGINVTAQLNDGSKKTVTVNASLSVDQPLPAPQFPQASGGYVLSNTITQDNQLEINIIYPGMLTGDTVVLSTSGKNSAGEVQTQAISTEKRIVSSAEATAQRLVISLPSSLILSVGTQGVFSANYLVISNGKAISISKTGSVTLLTESTQTFYCLMSTGSAIYDSQFGIQPQNRGTIYGVPGDLVNLKCDGVGYFPINGLQSQTLRLDNNGRAMFGISSRMPGAVKVHGENSNNANDSFEVTVDFQNYHTGDVPGFYAINNTSGAPDDGSIPCSIYVISESDTPVNYIQVMVPAGTEIIGFPGSLVTIPVNPDRSVAIDIISHSVASVDVALSFPELTSRLKIITLNYFPV